MKNSKMICNFYHTVAIFLTALEQLLGKNKIYFFIHIFNNKINIFIAGAIGCGWPFINYCLKQEGFFNSVCQTGLNETSSNTSVIISCPEQDQQIARFYSVMVSVGIFMVLPFSIFIYKFGFIASRLLCSLLVTGMNFCINLHTFIVIYIN